MLSVCDSLGEGVPVLLGVCVMLRVMLAVSEGVWVMVVTWLLVPLPVGVDERDDIEDEVLGVADVERLALSVTLCCASRTQKPGVKFSGMAKR